MLIDYIHAAMRQAKYEMLPEDGVFWGEIPSCQGVWATAPTLEACRDELQEVLEGWIMLGLRHHDPFPVIDGINLNDEEAA